MKFRGMTEEGKWVEGWYVQTGGSIKRHLIITEPRITDSIYSPTPHPDYIDAQYWKKIIPESLAMSTGQLDKHEKEIFGSIELENGEMSKGGDRVRIPEGEASVIWNESSFALAWDRASITPFRDIFMDCIEIIGTQFEQEKDHDTEN